MANLGNPHKGALHGIRACLLENLLRPPVYQPGEIKNINCSSHTLRVLPPAPPPPYVYLGRTVPPPDLFNGSERPPTAWVERRESAGAEHLVDVPPRGDDLRVDRLHVQPSALHVCHLGDDDVLVTSAQPRRVAAARHVTCSRRRTPPSVSSRRRALRHIHRPPTHSAARTGIQSQRCATGTVCISYTTLLLLYE